MSEENDPVIRVKDRRMFNPDGSLRDVAAAPEPPAETPAPATPPPSEPVAAALEPAPQPAAPQPPPEPEPDHEPELLERPDDVSLFSDLIVNLASQAVMYLGLGDNPLAPKMPADLPAARQMIDILAMLQEKTRGNLSSSEKVLLERILADLRMQYVAMASPRR